MRCSSHKICRLLFLWYQKRKELAHLGLLSSSSYFAQWSNLELWQFLGIGHTLLQTAEFHQCLKRVCSEIFFHLIGYWIGLKRGDSFPPPQNYRFPPQFLLPDCCRLNQEFSEWFLDSFWSSWWCLSQFNSQACLISRQGAGYWAGQCLKIFSFCLELLGVGSTKKIAGSTMLG